MQDLNLVDILSNLLRRKLLFVEIVDATGHLFTNNDIRSIIFDNRDFIQMLITSLKNSMVHAADAEEKSKLIQRFGSLIRFSEVLNDKSCEIAEKVYRKLFSSTTDMLCAFLKHSSHEVKEATWHCIHDLHNYVWFVQEFTKKASIIDEFLSIPLYDATVQQIRHSIFTDWMNNARLASMIDKNQQIKLKKLITLAYTSVSIDPTIASASI
ncbi:MAG: hypothetical protein MHMPM18_003552 [Marteilia pararefringens]